MVCRDDMVRASSLIGKLAQYNYIHVHGEVLNDHNRILGRQKQHGKHLEFSKSPNVSSNLITTTGPFGKMSSQHLCSNSKIPRQLQELSQLMSVGRCFYCIQQAVKRAATSKHFCEKFWKKNTISPKFGHSIFLRVKIWTPKKLTLLST